MSLHHNDEDPCPLCDAKLNSAHPYIADWFRKVKSNWHNCHISWAFRNEEAQNAAFLDKLTMLRWPMSAHNNMDDNKPCSLALDLFQIDEDGVARFSPKFYTMLWNWSQKSGYKLRWGGKFKNLGDAGHFEMLKGTDLH